VFISSHVTDHKFLEDVHEDSMQFSSQNSRFLCNHSDWFLKASGRPSVSRSFSVEDVRTSEQHHPDARSSFSNSYTELDFSRHCLGSLCKMSGWRGNTSGRCPAFQNISDFLFERGKELQQRLSRCSAKPSGRGPIMERIALFWKAVTENRPDEANFHLKVRARDFEFELKKDL
jgi:hypothetical protein